MLAVARGRSAGVHWLRSTAEELPLATGSLVNTEAFHFFDQPAALAGFYRVLRPGGTLVVVALADIGPAGRLVHRLTGRWIAFSQPPTCGGWPSRPGSNSSSSAR